MQGRRRQQARQLRGALAHTSAATKRRVLLDATARLLGADGWIARLGPSEEASIVRGERPARGALACADDDQRCLARSLYLLARGEAPPAPPRAAAPAPFYKRWWFWTIVGAAVAGGAATGIYFGTRTPSGVDVVATTR